MARGRHQHGDEPPRPPDPPGWASGAGAPGSYPPGPSPAAPFGWPPRPPGGPAPEQVPPTVPYAATPPLPPPPPGAEYVLPGYAAAPGRGAPLRDVATVLAVLLGCVCLVAGGLFALGFELPRRVDRTFDDPDVAQAVRRACERASTVSALPAPEPGDSDAELVRKVRAENAVVADVVAELRALGTDRLRGDPPAARWAADWAELAAAREAYARDLEGPDVAVLVLPRDAEGRAAPDRIADVSNGCQVPLRLRLMPFQLFADDAA